NIIPFETMRMLLGEAASIDLEPLPDSPDLIPEHISEFLPFALPISDRKQTRAVVTALRKIFSFTQLPNSYFYDNKDPIPLDPSDLIDTLKGQFPITDYDSLSRLSELRASLKKYYHFTRIPPLYFDLPIPERKDPLPLTPQELPPNLRRLFPLDPMLSPRDFSDMVGILREKYEFKRLPNDYILARPFIPNDPAKIKTDLIYTYPITDKQLAITFLTEIKRRYKFRLPLPRSIMTVNPTDKPELPRKTEDIPDFNITIPITSPKQLVDTARMLREVYYFDRLPEEWIDMIPITVDPETTNKPELPLKLEELTSYVKDNIPDIAAQVPITNYDTASQTIRTIQDHFNFTLIPNYLIDLPDLPTPEWEIFNDEPNH
ncbi:39034_t:CDS:1, partial [Gigaspora margarita]